MVEDHILKFRLSLSRTQSNPFFSKAIPGNDTFPIKTFLERCQGSMIIIYVKHLKILHDKCLKYYLPKVIQSNKNILEIFIERIGKVSKFGEKQRQQYQIYVVLYFTSSLWASITLSLTLKFKHNIAFLEIGLLWYIDDSCFEKGRTKNEIKRQTSTATFPLRTGLIFFRYLAPQIKILI